MFLAPSSIISNKSVNTNVIFLGVSL